ncbi:MAG TPA: cytochrome c [Rubricoccaceae bacterium]|nr:cytochrome c [Rubricoccaceae bacterium]
MTRTSLLLLAAVTAPLALAGCRGMKSERPPIHPNPNMDHQERFEEQEANPFFADQAAMRPPVPGTVARGRLRTTENAPVLLGRTGAGDFVAEIPVPVTEALLARGRERYDIYCSVCHGLAGDGRGIIMVGNGGQGYGFTPAPSYHSDFLRGVPDGYIFDVITNGVRSMPSYGHQVSPPDRWAIVAYIRALQRSQNAAPEDVPAPERERLETANPNVNVQQ